MKKVSYTDLESLIVKHNNQTLALREIQNELSFTKHQLTQYAVDNNLLDCITINVSRLERYATDNSCTKFAKVTDRSA